MNSSSYDTLGSPGEVSLPPGSTAPVPEDSIFFKEPASDGSKRLVDFVLVWEEKPKEPNYFSNCTKRATFISHLEEAGLETEEDEDMESKGIDLRFVKLHIPMEVLKRYAEILKLRMKLKASTGAVLDTLAQQSAEGEDMLEFKLEKENSPESDPHDPFRMPMVSLQNTMEGSFMRWLDRIQRPFSPDPNLFPRHQEHDYTATYSRDKDYLFGDDNAKFFSPAARSRIVEFILQRKRFLPDGADDDFAFGINRLINDGVYLAGYPLHDGTIKTPGSQRQLLSREWACWSKWWKYQPLDAVRDYYGVKMGLYFAWLGYYNVMLVPASLVGVLFFIYGVATVSSDTPTLDICGGSMANTTMCPICDQFCSPWLLEEACTLAWAKYMFDNNTTVFFAVFMSLWAAVFLEGWKRYSAEICHRWDVYGYDPEEEHPRPAYLLQLKDVKPEHWQENFVTQEREPRPPFWKMKLPGLMFSWTTVIFLVVLAGITVLAIILYRMSMIVALTALDDNTIKSNYSIFISTTGAAINLILILIFNYFYEYLAMCLTEKELHRTQTSFDDSLTLKIYLFQFINYYASIFYIAFIKGQFVGTPNQYIRLFTYRQEECQPGGCFMELTIQLAIIFMGKQVLLSVLEYYMPLMWKFLNLMKLAGLKKEVDDESGVQLSTPQHIKDFKLVEWGGQGLFYEYLEMVIQYGFITIFVCAFPLAPLFALLNNICELRLDAKKILELHRRPIAQKVRSIGVWFEIMETLGRISIITNAFIIALTSEFIPKMVYKYFYSKDQTLEGYVDFSLSHFDINDMDPGSRMDVTNTSTSCRYPDYRSGPDDEEPYSPNIKLWHIWFARLFFVIIFENVIAVTVMALKLLIPDVPAGLKYRIRRETFVTTQLIMEKERDRTARRRRRGETACSHSSQEGAASSTDVEVKV